MVPDPEKVLKDMMKGIDGLVTGDDASLEYGRIPFGVPTLDKMVGGGVPTKRLSIFTGQTNSGKTYLASQLVKSVQKQGGTAAWIDAEMTYDIEWMQRCGVDTEKLVVLQTSNGDRAFKASRQLMQGGIDLVVIDSIAGLAPESILEDDDKRPMAWQARFINSCLPSWIDDLQYGSALVAINQMTASMGPVYLDAMPGGERQKFMSHLILRVARTGWINEKDQKVGFDMKITMKKTKVGGEHYTDVTVPFRLDGGIDVAEIFIREFIERKMVQKSAAWYKIGDQSIMGMNNLKQWFLDNPETFESMKKEIEDDVNNS